MTAGGGLSRGAECPSEGLPGRVDLNLLLAALEEVLALALEGVGELGRQPLHRRLCDEHARAHRVVEVLDARSDVDGVADDRVLHARWAAHVSGDDHPGVYADTG